jgi:hypothetical protein
LYTHQPRAAGRWLRIEAATSASAERLYEASALVAVPATWRAAALAGQRPKPDGGRRHADSVEVDHLLAIGGKGGGGATTSVAYLQYRIDTAVLMNPPPPQRPDGRWSLAAPPAVVLPPSTSDPLPWQPPALQVARANARAMVVDDSTIVVVGGRAREDTSYAWMGLSSIEVLNGPHAEWQVIRSLELRVARYNFGLAFVP